MKRTSAVLGWSVAHVFLGLSLRAPMAPAANEEACRAACEYFNTLATSSAKSRQSSTSGAGARGLFAWEASRVCPASPKISATPLIREATALLSSSAGYSKGDLDLAFARNLTRQVYGGLPTETGSTDEPALRGLFAPASESLPRTSGSPLIELLEEESEYSSSGGEKKGRGFVDHKDSAPSKCPEVITSESPLAIVNRCLAEKLTELRESPSDVGAAARLLTLGEDLGRRMEEALARREAGEKLAPAELSDAFQTSIPLATLTIAALRRSPTGQWLSTRIASLEMVVARVSQAMIQKKGDDAMLPPEAGLALLTFCKSSNPAWIANALPSLPQPVDPALAKAADFTRGTDLAKTTPYSAPRGPDSVEPQPPNHGMADSGPGKEKHGSEHLRPGIKSDSDETEKKKTSLREPDPLERAPRSESEPAEKRKKESILSETPSSKAPDTPRFVERSIEKPENPAPDNRATYGRTTSPVEKKEDVAERGRPTSSGPLLPQGPSREAPLAIAPALTAASLGVPEAKPWVVQATRPSFPVAPTETSVVPPSEKLNPDDRVSPTKPHPGASDEIDRVTSLRKSGRGTPSEEKRAREASPAFVTGAGPLLPREGDRLRAALALIRAGKTESRELLVAGEGGRSSRTIPRDVIVDFVKRQDPSALFRWAMEGTGPDRDLVIKTLAQYMKLTTGQTKVKYEIRSPDLPLVLTGTLTLTSDPKSDLLALLRRLFPPSLLKYVRLIFPVTLAARIGGERM